MREPLEPLAVRPVARDHDLETRVARGSLEEEVDPLRAVEAVHGEDEVAVALAAVVERLRRMRQHLGRESRRCLEPCRDVLRDREEPRCLAERDAIERLHLAPERPVLRRVAELPERRAVELVGLPELVDEPDALVGVTDEIGGKLRRDDEVDLLPVCLVQVEHPPEEGLREHACARIPLEGHRDEICLVPRARSSSTSRSVKISAPPRANGTCGRGRRFSLLRARRLELGLEAIDLLLEVVDQPQRSSVERPLVVGQRLDVPAHELAQHGLDGRPDASADTRAKPERAIRGDGPEALGLGARNPPLVLAAAPAPGSAPERRTSSRSARKSSSTSTGELGRNPCRIAIFGVVRGHRGILAGS